MKLLSERINKALDHSGIKKIELAKRGKLSRATVSDWSSGKIKSINGDNLMVVADILGVNANWLATGNGQMLENNNNSEKITDAERSLLKIYRKLNLEQQDGLMLILESMAIKIDLPDSDIKSQGNENLS